MILTVNGMRRQRRVGKRIVLKRKDNALAVVLFGCSVHRRVHSVELIADGILARVVYIVSLEHSKVDRSLLRVGTADIFLIRNGTFGCLGNL